MPCVEQVIYREKWTSFAFVRPKFLLNIPKVFPGLRSRKCDDARSNRTQIDFSSDTDECCRQSLPSVILQQCFQSPKVGLSRRYYIDFLISRAVLTRRLRRDIFTRVEIIILHRPCKSRRTWRVNEESRDSTSYRPTLTLLDLLPFSPC